MKKNNKLLIIIAVLFINILVVYMVGQSIVNNTSKSEQLENEAKVYVEQGLYEKALQKYDELVVIEDTVELRLSMIDVYGKALESGEIERAYSVFNNLISMTEAHPKEVSVYEGVCELLVKYERYEQCAELLMEARGRSITSDKLTEILSQVQYKYRKNYGMYYEVLPIFNDMYTVSTIPTAVDEEAGVPVYYFLNNEASTEIEGGYTYASSFSSGYAFVKAMDNATGTEKAFVIDKEGVRQAYFEGVETSSGIGNATDKNKNDILLLACKVGDTYKYYDINGKEVFGDYAFAGRFRNNIAAVKDANGKWSFIDGTGKAITDKTFEDVILNEFDECSPRNMIIAKENGKYHIYNGKLEKVGNFSCDYAKSFVNEKQYAAFKSGDLWGFVDAEGNVVIQPQYEDAKSFSNDMGAVKVDGQWNLINPKNEIIVEETFEDVGYLSDQGICFVKMRGNWGYLQMFYTAE